MGRTRKITAFHVVEKTLNATRHKDRANEPQPDGRPVKPKFLRGKASKLWDDYVGIGYWLTVADSHALAAWCGLTAELERDLKNMTASRISQWRALGSELGFQPGSRSRINVGNAITKPKSASEKYLA